MTTIYDEITSIKINEVKDNEIGSEGSKLKLRPSSFMNIKVHGQNLKVVSDFNIMTSNIPDTVNYGFFKPINVKKNMISNIKSHFDIIDTNFQNFDAVSNENNSMPITLDSENIEKTVDMEYGEFDTSISSSVQSEINISNYLETINNEKQLLADIQLKVAAVEEEVSQSEQLLNELSIEETEAQKKLHEAELKNKAIKEQIMRAIEEQAKAISMTRKKSERSIKKANERKEEYSNKIVDIQSRLGGIKNKTSELEEDNARQQEILNSIFSMGSNSIIVDGNEESENIKSRAA